nr:pyridoxal 5'-phosphate synthase glutaminase subunit PdxT [candidate division Zixibacteria bacterium]
MYSHLTIGVLALQGDFERHLYRLSALKTNCREIRTGGDLSGLDGLIIPGGESTTMSMLLDRFVMRPEMERFCFEKPVWGTCAGMIMLAREVDDVRVKPLKIIDISIARNGYGRQVYSFHTEVKAHLNGHDVSLPGSFIRAPVVMDAGPEVKILARHDNSPVLLIQGKCLVSSFHTELDDDLTLTRYFLDHLVMDTGVI